MPTVFDSGNEELQILREDRTLPRLDAYFWSRIREWPHPLKDMECFTVGVFFDLGSAFQNGNAFELLDTAAQLLRNELPDRAFLLGVDLLLELATASGTTEMPQTLIKKWDSIECRVKMLDSTYPAWHSLARHYNKPV